jgi:hypothetical protein
MTKKSDQNSPAPAASFVEYLQFAFDRSPKTEAEIARELGYSKPEIIKLMRSGTTKVPIDRIPALARSLNVEPAHMMTLALEDYAPQMLRALEETFEFLATPNEREIIKVVRHLSNNSDPRLTAALRQEIEEHFQTYGFNEG